MATLSTWPSKSFRSPPPTTGEGRHFLILFHAGAAVEETQSSTPSPRRTSRKQTSAEHQQEIEGLQKELIASREYLQSIIQDLEAANEELQSANEEILSSNEELQSTNEELDTAKEELQSTNEELNTVNEELHGRNEELGRINSDLVNLLNGVQIAIVIVARDLRIRRFTPMAEKVLNLIPGDIGRPISQIKPNINAPDLENLISEVIDTVNIQQREVQDQHGRTFSMTIRPYKNTDNRIDGAVLVLFDIDEVRRHEQEAQKAREFAEFVLTAAPVPLVVMDPELKIRDVNPAFCEKFSIDKNTVQGRSLWDLDGGAWNMPQLREQLGQILPGDRLDKFEFEQDFPGLGRQRVFLQGWRTRASANQPAAILFTVMDS